MPGSAKLSNELATRSLVTPMRAGTIAILAMTLSLTAQATAQAPPKSGPVEILPLSEVQPGMQATAWTTFRGTEPEPVPVEILGKMANAWGPRQDIILAKLGGPAIRTNVAGGMSGSPVYIDGKLIGAIALRFSTFSPDAIAGITPIELMLEIDEMDRSKPMQARLPAAGGDNLAEQVWAAAAAPPAIEEVKRLEPIETPLVVSGMSSEGLRLFSNHFAAQGVEVMAGGAYVQAGAAAAALAPGAAAGALNPGEPIAVVLMAGDLSATALGTVSYNDGQRALGFGHAMFNAGPIEAPIATGDVLLVLASQLNPVKIANAGSVVGALRQDRHSGILGVLGETADLTPVHVNLRQLGEGDEVVRSKEFDYQVFQNEKWTPQLLLLALFNSTFQLNDFAEETTFRISAEMALDGADPIAFRTMQAESNQPIPTPLLVANQVASRVARVFTNTRETPDIERIDVTIDLLPSRRTAEIEQVWVERRRVRPGDTLEGKVILQPYRGVRQERPFSLKIPAGAPKGRLALVASDSGPLNQRRQAAAGRNRSLSLNETVSLLNQELSNDTVYVSLIDRTSPTAHVDDRSLPNLPLTTLGVMRPAAQGRMAVEMQSPLAEAEIETEAIVSGTRAVGIEIE